jgi:two-component system sensor histidine kinase YesM
MVTNGVSMKLEIFSRVIKLKNSITKKINDISLRTKLIVFMLTIILATSGCIAIFSYKAAEKTILDQSQKSSSSYLNQISERFDMFMQNIHRGILSIAYNKDLIKTIKQSDLNTYEELDNFMRNINMIEAFANVNRSIYSLSIYDLKNDWRINSNGEKGQINKKSGDFRILKQLFIDSSERLPYKWIETRQIFENNSNRRIITFVMPINFWDETKINTVIVANINEDEISRIYSDVDTASNGEVYLVNEKNTIISSRDKRLIGKQLEYISIPGGNRKTFSHMEYLNGEKCLVTYVKSDYIKWVFFSVIPERVLMKTYINVLKNTFILITLITIVVIFIISIFVNMLIYKPVERLIHEIMRNDNNTGSDDLYLTSRNEIGFLFKRFNEILQEKKDLVKNVYDQKLLLKDAEIRLLHSQINSHFLYNTLDTIIWMAKANDYGRIIIMVKSMVVFFRISLDRGNEIIPVSRVKEQLDSYFVIQGIRFGDRMKVLIDIDMEILEYKMLKLLLQPIVENSVLHGIEKKMGEGLITITGTKEDGMLKFIIEDNGVGIPDEKLAEVNRIINEEEQDVKDFYALQNINKRIRLFYGSQYGIKIESCEGEGARVSISVPIIKEGVGL